MSPKAICVTCGKEIEHPTLAGLRAEEEIHVRNNPNGSNMHIIRICNDQGQLESTDYFADGKLKLSKSSK